MKKRISLILAGVLLLSVFLTACGGSNTISDGLYVNERQFPGNFISIEFEDGQVTLVPALVWDSNNNTVDNTERIASYSGGYTYDGKTLTIEKVIDGGNKSWKVQIVDKDTFTLGMETFKRQ